MPSHKPQLLVALVGAAVLCVPAASLACTQLPFSPDHSMIEVSGRVRIVSAEAVTVPLGTGSRGVIEITLTKPAGQLGGRQVVRASFESSLIADGCVIGFRPGDEDYRRIWLVPSPHDESGLRIVHAQ
jgi:hypothetical protein